MRSKFCDDRNEKCYVARLDGIVDDLFPEKATGFSFIRRKLEGALTVCFFRIVNSSIRKGYKYNVHGVAV